jgi:hypothetical protein
MAQMRTVLLASALALVTGSAPAAAATIGFNNLVTNDSFTTYTESAFTVSVASGSWQAFVGYGNPAPFILFTRAADQPTISASIQVTAGGSPFTFSAVDLYSSVTTIPYQFQGFLNSALVFTLSDTVPNTFGGFATVNSNTTLPIDVLLITLFNPATPCCGNPVGLDNIVVTVAPSTIPEPTTVVLIGTSGVAAAVRRRVKTRP